MWIPSSWRFLLSSRTWLAPVTLATRADEAGGPPIKVLRGPGQPPITSKLGHPAVPLDALKRSLARILDASVGPDAIAPQPPEKQPAGPPGPPKAQEYTLDHHFSNKS